MAVRHLLLAFLVCVASGARAEDADVPHEFAAGEPARASEVNDNFNALSEALRQALIRVEEAEAAISEQSAELDRQAEEIAAIQRQVPIVLDLNEVPVTIDQPGRYVLDRDWTIGMGLLVPSITIAADNVSLDMRGYTIVGDSRDTVYISGDRISIVDGWFQTAPIVVGEESFRVTIDSVHLDNRGAGSPLALNGGTVVVSNSTAVGMAGIGIGGGQHQLRNVSMRGQEGHALVVAGGTVRVSDSTLTARREGVVVRTDGNTFERNTISTQSFGYGIDLQGDGNRILDNRFSGVAGTAILVSGTGNLLRGNLAHPETTQPAFSLWDEGIRFSVDGNLYGSNTMMAVTPFNLGSTSQLDLGGNHGTTE